MHRIVVDTNVIVSAIGWKGYPRKVLDKCIDGKFKLIESVPLLTEAMDVLNRPKFSFIQRNDREEFFRMLVEISELVDTPLRLSVIKDDERDNRVLECAVAGEADFIVSGDAHLLGLKRFGNIIILTSKEILK